MRSTVVLPEPEGPRIANNSPSPTVRSAPSTATTLWLRPSPNSLRMPISSICGSSTAADESARCCAPTVPEGIGRSYEFRGPTAAPSAISACLQVLSAGFRAEIAESRDCREEGADVVDQQVRGLHGREVAAGVELAPVHDVVPCLAVPPNG